jgi:hypothetical protein
MEKYYPAGDKLDGLHVAAYVEGQLAVEVLKRCGDLLTRENVMKQAADLRNVKPAMLQSGIAVNTASDNYNMFKRLQLSVFDGKYLAPLGQPIGE